MDDLKLYGGPGCGKTRGGIEWLLHQVEQGADVERVAFVSFTNAAVDEARDRICNRFFVAPDDLPFCRTLHSLCKRALGITDKDWLADSHLQAFGDDHGYDVRRRRKSTAEEGVEASSSAGEDAGLLDVWDFARQRGITDADAGYQAFAAYDPDGTARIRFPRFQACIDDYEDWKRENALRDYTDLLQEIVAHPVRLRASVAVIDEAQDLSPLMWQAADALFRDAELRATLGDDDQAIYSFGGAEPALMNRRPATEIVKLRQSYRLPRLLAENANRIIARNGDREPKELEPLTEGGTVDRATDVGQLPLSSGSWFLLARNWALLPQFEHALETLGLPYRYRGGRYSPWSDRGPLRAAQALWALSGGEAIPLADLLPLVQRTPSANSRKAGVWVHGAKKRLETECETHGERLIGWRDLPRLGMVSEAFARLMKRDLFLMEGKISERDIRAYENAIRRGHWQEPVRLTLGSIHSVKGQEADHVAILLGCTGAPARAMLYEHRREEERRVAYVGATRARQSLYGVLPEPGGNVFPWELIGA
jgi:superfamily I DNA/RNA helicase